MHNCLVPAVLVHLAPIIPVLASCALPRLKAARAASLTWAELIYTPYKCMYSEGCTKTVEITVETAKIYGKTIREA